ncbi:hypothetical protein QF041_002866 [Paenibacillus sp. W2I17]|nr:hypothetical protein [Paenibacillus sp. W2I17]
MRLSEWNAVWTKPEKRTQFPRDNSLASGLFLCLNSLPFHACLLCQGRLLLTEDTKWFQRSGSIPHCSKTFMMSIWVASTCLPVGLRSSLFGCFIFIPLTSLIFILSLPSKTSLIILEKVPRCCRLMAITFFEGVLILSKAK